MLHGNLSLNSVLLLILVSLVSCFRLGSISACAATLAHRNHLFRLCQQNKSSKSKLKFRQVSNHCKRVLESDKRAYANKTN